MFSIFNVKKKVIVDCFTVNRFAYENTPIIKATKTIPEWWKKLPLSKTEFLNENFIVKSTMKSCSGFKDLYKRGYVLEHWCDLNVHVDKNGYWYNSTDSIFYPTEHPNNQYAGGFNNFYHMKLQSPWLLKEKNGYPFLLIGAEWGIEIPIKILPGICDFKYNSTTNVNIFIPKNKFDFNIPTGTPLIHFIPLRDDINFIFKNHQISEQEHKKLFPDTDNIEKISFVDRFNKFVKLKKRNENRKNNKCPFHF